MPNYRLQLTAPPPLPCDRAAAEAGVERLLFKPAIFRLGRVLPSELRKSFVQGREASQRPALRAQRTQSIERSVSPLAEKQT